MKTEIWLPIPGWEGFYSVSNMGRVRGERRTTPGAYGKSRPRYEHVMSQNPNTRGYLCVHLRRDVGGKKTRFYAPVHILVALAFIGPRPGNHDVDHEDEVKTNNRADNLKYLPATVHRRMRQNDRIGESHGNTKITDFAVRDIRNRYQRGMGVVLAKEYGVSGATISSIVARRIWKHVS